MAGGQAAVPPVRLLFDKTLAPSLALRLSDLYPGSVHVREVGLTTADDEQIWQHARDIGYIIITKDDDFRQRSFLRGAPPQSSLGQAIGTCSTADVEQALRSRYGTVVSFAEDEMAALLVLARP